jgi:thiol-disulfide isomerase/thioredoxin
MIFLHINSKTNNAALFNKYVEQGKQIFVLFYMEGCGPCNMTRPEWKKIENILSTDKNNNIVVVDIDQEVLEELKYLQSKPMGFPTMRYIANKGKTSDDYDGERNIDAFMKWIQSKSTFKKSYAKRRAKNNSTFSTFKKSGAKNNSTFKKRRAKNNSTFSTFKKRRAKNNYTLNKKSKKGMSIKNK